MDVDEYLKEGNELTAIMVIILKKINDKLNKNK